MAVYERVKRLRLMRVVRRGQRVALRGVARAGRAGPAQRHAPALRRRVRGRLRAVAAAVRCGLDPDILHVTFKTVSVNCN